MLYTVRAAIGGFIVTAVDDLEDEEEEVVFTSVGGALEYLRGELVGLPDAPETPPEGPDSGAART